MVCTQQNQQYDIIINIAFTDHKMFLSIAFLTITVISSLVSTQSQQTQNQPEHNCNTCCQGGVPGTPGHNGLPGRDGRDGMRGDKGEAGMNIKGDKGDTGFGEIGLPGPQGLRGEKGDQGLQGVGLPGKTGPRGPMGPEGNQGIPGRAGTIGMKGEKGDCGRCRKSAFTAVKMNAQTGNVDDVVTFQEITVNIDGHFSLQSNKFTCQIPGIYVFMFSMGVYRPTQPHIMLVKNDNLVVTALAHTTTATDFDQTSNSAILNLEAGDQVWLKFGHQNGHKLHSHSYRFSSFSGFLLYEI
ncbi:uncharacterized protein [Amphiura filiformis]|uniref:uncharacterized protein n=1 Tax=Amphiura filiformis TaxID=82378 RepID=UPI003B213E53